MECEVLIIGGGITGVAVARDLALRGLETLVVERKDLCSGASGANHGLLHSGARYVLSDPQAARECAQENAILKRVASHCIEDTGGLYVAMDGDEEDYVASFPGLCQGCGIEARPLELDEVFRMEPALSRRVTAAYFLPDASINPFRLVMDTMAHALRLGARLLERTRVASFVIGGDRILSVRIENLDTRTSRTVYPRFVVNAAGPWAGRVAGMAGRSVPMIHSKGTLVVTRDRLTRRVVHRLRPPGDGDIVVPAGSVSILGTTSIRVENPGMCFPQVEETKTIVKECATMVPSIEGAAMIRAYSGVRPLVEGNGEEDDREVSRGFNLVDHSREGISNFVTITGGKLTTFRLMAEKTADLVCQRLGRKAECSTRTEILPETRKGRWTEPGTSALFWSGEGHRKDLVLCECEVVPKEIVEEVGHGLSEENREVDLLAVAFRTRIGKGPCQGTFCSLRISAYLYETERFKGRRGLESMVAFLRERWRGKRVLFSNQAMVHHELQEALFCGLMGLDLESDTDGPMLDWQGDGDGGDPL